MSNDLDRLLALQKRQQRALEAGATDVAFELEARIAKTLQNHPERWELERTLREGRPALPPHKDARPDLDAQLAEHRKRIAKARAEREFWMREAQQLDEQFEAERIEADPVLGRIAQMDTELERRPD